MSLQESLLIFAGITVHMNINCKGQRTLLKISFVFCRTLSCELHQSMVQGSRTTKKRDFVEGFLQTSKAWKGSIPFGIYQSQCVMIQISTLRPVENTS